MSTPARQSHAWYAPGDANSPRVNPTYVDAVAEVLLGHRDELVCVQRRIGGDPWSVHEAVEVLRSFGWVIDGERGKAGYIFRGWQRPERWLRIERVCREHLAAVVLYVPRRRYYEPLPGQLQFEIGGIA